MVVEYVSLTEVIAAARGRHASLVPESSGYLLLGLFQASGGRPVQIDPARIMLSSEGAVSVLGGQKRVSAEQTTLGIRQLLGDLLAVSKGRSPALAALAQRRDDAPARLDLMASGINKALIPINRGAARRALARLARETLRAKVSGLLALEEPVECAGTQAPLGERTAGEVGLAADGRASAPAEPQRATQRGGSEPCAKAACAEPDAQEPVGAAPPLEDWEHMVVDIQLATPTPEAVFELATDDARAFRPVGFPEKDVAVEVEDDGDEVERAEPEVAAFEVEEIAQEPTPSVELVLTCSDVVGLEVAPADLGSDRPTMPDLLAHAHAEELAGVEPETSAAVEPEALAAAELETLATVEPEAMAAVEPEAPAAVEPEAMAAVEPEAPAAVEPEAPVEPEAMAAVEPEAMAAVEPEAMAAVEPEALVVVEPEAPVVVEPEAPVAVEPEAPAAVEPEAAICCANADPIDAEEQLVGRLLGDAARPLPKSVAATATSGRPTFAKAPGDHASADALLERFAEGGGEVDQLLAAAQDLTRLVVADTSPTPPPGMASVLGSLTRPAQRARRGAPRGAHEEAEDIELAPAAADACSAPVPMVVRAPIELEPCSPEPSTSAEVAAEEVAAEDSWASEDVALDQDEQLSLDAEVAFSVSPEPVQADEGRDTVSGLPPPGSEHRRRWPLAASLVTLLTGVAALGLVMARPAWLSTVLPAWAGPPRAESVASPPAATHGEQSPRCHARLELTGLPSPHEILVRLGEAPLATRPLPTGVRLELIAMATGQQPQRVVIPADAHWVEVTEGERKLAVDLLLEPTRDPVWPAAAAGQVGGVGPEGRIHVSTNPAAEIWLVSGAGDDDRQSIVVPCAETAHILVIDPTAPAEPYRLSVAPKLLEAAAQNGGAELPVRR